VKKYLSYILLVIGALIIAFLLIAPLPTYEIPILHFGEDKEPEARIVFGGDMMFDRYIRQIMETVGGDYVFSCIDRALGGADAVVANLEGPITNNASVSINTEDGDEGHYTFTFPPEVAPLLARHNIFVVNIGNNHIANFSWEGITQTKEYLTKADVAYFGDPQSSEEDRVLHLSFNDIPFAFVSWSDWTSDKTDHTVAQVAKEVAAGNVTVVYAHWGDEYVAPPERVKALAHQFVDAGAALVVGSHPHIVQEIERYKDKYIYYSLGNFIFDQYFSEEVKNGLLLSVVFTSNGVEAIQEIPIQLHTDGRTCVADPVER